MARNGMTDWHVMESTLIHSLLPLDLETETAKRSVPHTQASWIHFTCIICARIMPTRKRGRKDMQDNECNEPQIRTLSPWVERTASSVAAGLKEAAALTGSVDQEKGWQEHRVPYLSLNHWIQQNNHNNRDCLLSSWMSLATSWW